MTEVFLENQRLDISEGLSNLLNYNIDDIKDVGSRNTSFSKTLIFPGTSNNNTRFGHIFDVRVSNQYDSTARNVGYNFNPSQQANCVIFQDHLQVFKGILRLNKMIILDGICEYECTVFGELGGLIHSIGNNKLQDLDFSVYDHVWNAANVTGSWDATGGTSYYYPLIDYGTVSVAKHNYDIRAFRPALYVKEYIDKIFEMAAYDYACDLFSTDRFIHLVIPNNQKALQTVTDRLVQGVSVITDQVIIQDGVAQEASIPQEIRTVASFTYSGGVYTYTGTDTLTFKINATITGDYYSTIESVQLQVKKNGAQVYTGVPFLIPTFGTTPVNFTHTTPDVYATMSTGDTIELSGKVANNVGSYRLRTDFVLFEIRNPVPIYVDLSPGGTLTITDTVPRNILQRDFLVWILKLFNLYVYEDPLKTKFVNIKPYVDFYDLNVSGVTDWTQKMDRGRAIELIPMSELNNRYYNFKFKPDVDYYNDLYKKRYNETYGDYILDTQFFFTDGVGNIDIGFSPSITVGFAGEDKFAPALYKKNAGVEERTETNIRILQTKKIDGVSSWNMMDGASVLISGATKYGYGGNYDDPDAPANDIHFGVPRELFFTLLTGSINITQFNVYWSSYMAEITDKDSKLLVAFFRLTNKDIFALDFSKLVYIDGSYWRLNKVIDWNASEPDTCKVELLKAIILVY